VGNRGIEGINSFVLLLYLGNNLCLSQVGNLKHVAVFTFKKDLLNSHRHAAGLVLFVFGIGGFIFRLNSIHGALLDVRHNDLLLV
jgi:energy-converting hydrogenase Eha subunit B